MAVKFGVFVPQGWRMDLVEIADPVEKFEAMTNVARLADEDGWDSIWVYDHFHTVPTPEIETTFECWSITATLARDTKRVRIGQMVGCNGYRNPALYAKIASTVDVASHGRIDAGIGAGWYEHEWRAFGYQWDETPIRMAKFREAVEIVHKMWTEEKPVFHGKHYAIDGPINEPKGAQQPHIPLWIGGGGEQVTLKLVAKWGDACNVGGGRPDVCRQKLDVLKRHCDEQGRDYAEIIKSSNIFLHLVEDEARAEQETAAARGNTSFENYSRSYLVANVDGAARRIEELIAAGIDYVILYMPRLAYDQTAMRRFVSEVMPKFS